MNWLHFCELEISYWVERLGVLGLYRTHRRTQGGPKNIFLDALQTAHNPLKWVGLYWVCVGTVEQKAGRRHDINRLKAEG